MPKLFVFGKRKRSSKPRGLSLLRLQEAERESAVINSDHGSVINSDHVSTTVDAATNDNSDCTMDTADTPTRIESKLSAYDLLNPDQQNMFSSGGHFLLIHTAVLSNVVGSLVCPSCSSQTLSVSYSSKQGLSSCLDVHCSNCERNVSSQFTSPMGPKRHDINMRTVLASKETGIGYTKIVNLFAIMNVPMPVHKSTYVDISKDVHKAAVDAAESVMCQAADVIKERYSCGTLVSDKVSGSGCPVTTISFDGTWHKRGHSSHNGVGVAIDADTGLVVDTHTVCNYCSSCEKNVKAGMPGYTDWYATHKINCQKNSDCSSNAMEVIAASTIFSRSIASRGLVYGNMLCDGDAKSVERVKNVYNDIHVDKLDCVNHIAKRMFNSLDNLKKCNKAQLNRKLTKPMIDKITNTYAKNLKDNAPDVTKMKFGVMGGILHMASTDEHPNHKHCPEGEISWCAYQRALSSSQPPPPHKPTFKPDILPYIWPIVKHLTEPELLQRCSKMQTQNANESFNAQVWTRCPKTLFANRWSVETGVALAVLSFNCGPSALRLVMNRLGLRWEKICYDHANNQVQEKVYRARNTTAGISKWKRKHRKSKCLALEHVMEATEGSTYESGAFNF